MREISGKSVSSPVEVNKGAVESYRSRQVKRDFRSNCVTVSKVPGADNPAIFTESFWKIEEKVSCFLFFFIPDKIRDLWLSLCRASRV